MYDCTDNYFKTLNSIVSLNLKRNCINNSNFKIQPKYYDLWKQNKLNFQKAIMQSNFLKRYNCTCTINNYNLKIKFHKNSKRDKHNIKLN